MNENELVLALWQSFDTVTKACVLRMSLLLVNLLTTAHAIDECFPVGCSVRSSEYRKWLLAFVFPLRD